MTANTQSPLPGWQPIETAPKDGTRILAYAPDSLLGPTQAVIYWWELGDEIALWCGADETPFRATHWMPLPEPPK